MIHVALTQNARDDRVYLRKRVSTGYFRVEFSSAGHLRPRDLCVNVRVYVHTSGACMPRVVDFSKRCAARTFLSACSHMCACMYAPHRTTIHRYLPRPSSGRGMMRVAIACMCTCSRVATRYRVIAPIVFYALSLRERI